MATRKMLSVLNLCALIAVAGMGSGVAKGDLAQEFQGFDAIFEQGVSGLMSSYHAPTKAGNALPSSMVTFGPGRVSYPNGVGEQPSPGGSVGSHFDEGAMGIKVEGLDLVVAVAGALDPQQGWYYSGLQTWYGQGDVFLTVEDATGLQHFALLNAWARDASGQPRTLDGGHFDQAEAFHVGGGAGGASLEGHLVRLDASGDVVMVGGAGAYYPGYSPAPDGLDYRGFAQGGTDMGNAGIVHSSVLDSGQTWYVQEWTVPLASLTAETAFTIGLHKTASCGNDQIGMKAVFVDQPVIPAPGACVLCTIGLAFLGWMRRRSIPVDSQP